MNSNGYPTWIEIDLSKIKSNVKYIIEKTGKPLMAVVKANAYGFGAVEVAKAALEAGASWLAVARFGEAEVLRDAGINAPILVLGATLDNDICKACDQNITLTLYGEEAAELYSKEAKKEGKTLNVHLKVDTGMGRLGVYPEEIVDLAQKSLALGNINIDGIYSHFSMAAIENHPHTALQRDRFITAIEALKSANLLPKWVHLANSAGTYYEPENDLFNMNRAGSAIVGLHFRDEVPFPEGIQRAFEWKARLASCKVLPKGWGIGYGQTYIAKDDEIIGSLPIGYGDGYRRVEGNEVIIDGQKVPVVGKECMDQTMIKLPKTYAVGTEVVLAGSQGNESIFVEELGKKWGTVEVDVTTLINKRVPRIYKK